jgi:hypothetical protein
MTPDYQSGGRNERGESIMELIRGIFHDARTLSSKEFTAVKLEIRQEISKALIPTQHIALRRTLYLGNRLPSIVPSARLGPRPLYSIAHLGKSRGSRRDLQSYWRRDRSSQ